MGITTLRRRHDAVEVAEADRREPSALEREQTQALADRNARASRVEVYKAEHPEWEQFDADSDEAHELAELERVAQEAEDALTEATNAVENERRVAQIEGAKPSADAPVADWRAWAVEHLGLAEDEVKSLDKAKLKKLEIK